MQTPGVVNVSEVIDSSPVSRFQVSIVVLCTISLIMDGFDMQSVGYVAPALVQEWGIASAELGRVFGAGLVGTLFGALLCSIAADKVGRRPILIGGTFAFGALTLAAAFAGSVPQLLVIRFLAGLALGGIMPNAMALVGEYTPKSRRVTLMMTTSVGFTAGAAFGGFVSAWLIPSFGWRSVFYVGGVIPLVVALIMYWRLPESMPFLVARKRGHVRVVDWLQKINPALALHPATQFVVHEEEHRGGIPVIHLFREGRAIGTILIWVLNFMNLLNLFFLSNWLPTVVREAGYATSTAVLVGTTLQVGGTLGTLGLAWFIGRIGFVPVLTTAFAIACLSVGLIGTPGLSLGLIFVVVFVAGWCVVGGQPAVNALAGVYYPTYLRSTGIGWGLGIGRIGAIIGPVVAGELLARQWTANDVFRAAAVPALISALVMFSLRWILSPGSRATGKSRGEAVAH